MTNQKRRLADSVSCPTMKNPLAPNNLIKIRSKRKTPFELRCAKQQTRRSGSNQLKRIAVSRSHHRKVQVGKDQEKAQSERDSHSK